MLLRGGAAQAGPPSIDDHHDGPLVAWRLPPSPGGARVVAHSRVRLPGGGPTAGASSLGVEHVRVVCPPGYAGVFLYPIGRAPVVDEFGATVRVRADRQGVRLAARVVLPTEGPASATPGPGPTPALSIVVRGETIYGTPGRWAELTLADLPRRVRRQARLLRAGVGADRRADAANVRAAFVDALVLIVPGGPEGTDFWVDRVRVDGPLLDGAAKAARTHDADPAPRTDGPGRVDATAAGLAVDGRVVFPKIWRSRGEAMSLVAAAGFDAVAIDGTPDAETREQAADAGLRVICPLPATSPAGRPASRGPAPSPATGVADPDIAGVLAWSLPEGLTLASIDPLRPALDHGRTDPLLSRRPLIASPEAGIRAWSRLADGLVLDATPRGPGGGGGDFASLMSRAQPDCLALARVRLTRPPLAREQIAAFASAGRSPRWRATEAVRRELWTAIAAGARGLWIEADLPLGGALPEDRAMAATLELLHRKLDLIGPWIAGGERAGAAADTHGRPAGAIFIRDRTRLIVGVANDAGYPAVDRPASTRSGDLPPVGLIVPGAPETAAAYRLTAAGLAPVRSRRVLGGTLLDTPAPTRGELLLVADDRLAVRQVERRASGIAAEALALQQELAIGRLRRFEQLLAELAGEAAASPLAGAPAAAKRLISRSKAAEASGDLVGACLNAERASAVLRRATAELGGRVAPADRLDSSPLAATPETWPQELRLRQLLRPLPRRGNRLAGGDFEDLRRLQEQGWRHTRLQGREATVELSPVGAKHGEKCLSIHAPAGAADPTETTAWVASPPTPIEAGQLIEVTGWVRFARPPSDPGGSPPGRLAIVDSLGGDTLGLAVTAAEQWRPFRLLRRAADRREVQLSFVLYGAGRAWVDAVMIRPISLTAPRLRAAGRSGAPAGPAHSK